MGSSPFCVKLKTMKYILTASPLSIQLEEEQGLLSWNEENVSEQSDMSTRRLLFQSASTRNIKLKPVGLVQNRHQHLIKCNLFST